MFEDMFDLDTEPTWVNSEVNHKENAVNSMFSAFGFGCWKYEEKEEEEKEE